MRNYLILVMAAGLVLSGCQSGTESMEQEEVSQEDGAPGNVDKDDMNQEDSNPAEVGSELSLLNMSTEDWEMEVLADELTYPWDLHVMDNLIVMPEVVGNMLVLQDGQLERFEVQTSDPIVQEGGSGLLGLELAEDFQESGIGYIYYSYRSDFGLANKVARVVYDGNAWQETDVLIGGIPGHELYNGGRMAIGPDGYLYVATGWAHVEEYAQDLDSLGGKILRMNLDGSIPEGNPFENSYVYSYGHRNPQGLAWNEDGTILYSSEHGSSGQDEINIIEPGNNYGWPDVTGDDEREGITEPVLHSGNDTWAPSGIAFSEGNLLVTGLKGESLYAYNESASSLDPIFSSNERLRNVFPYQGDLYLITTNTSPRADNPGNKDRLFRISPVQ
ncbi:PQQ-dependent sugar dehydrogenase [Bacillus sp. AK031]